MALVDFSVSSKDYCEGFYEGNQQKMDDAYEKLFNSLPSNLQARFLQEITPIHEELRYQALNNKDGYETINPDDY